jgi:hypothetical protein
MQNVAKTVAGTLLERLTGEKKDAQPSALPKPAVGEVLKGLFGR